LAACLNRSIILAQIEYPIAVILVAIVAHWRVVSLNSPSFCVGTENKTEEERPVAEKGTETSSSGTLKLDRDNLYFAAPWLSLENKKALGLTVPAWIYVQDPLVAQRNRKLGLEEIHVSREHNLAHGPTSARLAVVDYSWISTRIPRFWAGPSLGRFRAIA
jgi:hypothetical protein